MIAFISSRPGWLMVPAILALCVGCGPSYDLAPITGTVTLDGDPLPNATVEFIPEAGRPSRGTTDSAGEYSLQYTATTQGAEFGTHMVRISTFTTGDPDADPPVPASEERLPAKYNVKSELEVEATPETTRQDFELDSDGEIVQPMSMSGGGASYSGGGY